MADPKKPDEGPRVYDAELASGASGAVEYGRELTNEEAVERRRNGLDIVVRGESTAHNRAVARKIESMVGPPTKAQTPEPKAGPFALPHFHQQSRHPEGHAFYETTNRKARMAR